MIAAGAIIGLGYGSVQPIFQAQIINSVERSRVGIANSLYFNAMDMGMAVGAFVLGMVANSFGYRGIYVAGVILIVMGGIFFTLYQKAGRRKAVVLNEQFQQK